MTLADLRRILTAPNPSLPVLFLRLGLRVLSFPYSATMKLRNWAYDCGIKRSYQSAAKVISVGNLSVGGTGKSPAVAWLAQWFRDRNVRVAILSRGYGALDNGQNDEALELEMRFPDVPHLQNPDRIASAILAEEELEMQLLLLDDGFQHRRIKRDLDIVLIDATDAQSARRPLPGGLLRESMQSLVRSDVVMLTRADQAGAAKVAALEEKVGRIAPNALIVQAFHRPTHLRNETRRDAAETLEGTKVLAFCAIGNPESFFFSLQTLGATTLDTLKWPDHHGYTASDVAQLEQWALLHSDAEMIVCTMKDWVKIQSDEISGIPLVALAIEMEISCGVDQLEERLTRLADEL